MDKTLLELNEFEMQVIKAALQIACIASDQLIGDQDLLEKTKTQVVPAIEKLINKIQYEQKIQNPVIEVVLH